MKARTQRARDGGEVDRWILELSETVWIWMDHDKCQVSLSILRVMKNKQECEDTKT